MKILLKSYIVQQKIYLAVFECYLNFLIIDITNIPNDSESRSLLNLIRKVYFCFNFLDCILYFSENNTKLDFKFEINDINHLIYDQIDISQN